MVHWLKIGIIFTIVCLSTTVCLFSKQYNERDTETIVYSLEVIGTSSQFSIIAPFLYIGDTEAIRACIEFEYGAAEVTFIETEHSLNNTIDGMLMNGSSDLLLSYSLEIPPPDGLYLTLVKERHSMKSHGNTNGAIRMKIVPTTATDHTDMPTFTDTNREASIRHDEYLYGNSCK